jgi:transcriptional regulator with XRE-family HTH domain
VIGWIVVGRRIRAGRALAGWTQHQLAVRAGVPRNRISLVECGKAPGVSCATMVALCRALGLSLDAVFAED